MSAGDVHAGSAGVKTGLGGQPPDEEVYASQIAVFDPPVLDTSLCFAREAWTAPTTDIGDNRELRYHIPRQNSLYLDPSSLRFHGSYDVQKSNDGRNWEALDDADIGKVSVIQFLPECLIDSLTITINGHSISFIGTSDYPYKVYLENICSYNHAAAKHMLQPSGYAEEVVGQDHNDANSGGNKIRSEWICKGTQGFNFPVHSDLLSTDRFIIDIADIDLKITRTADSFLLLAPKPGNLDLNGGAGIRRYRIKLNKMDLHWRKVSLAPNLKIDIDKALASGVKARYPIVKTQIKWGNVQKGANEMNLTPDFNILPFMVIVGFFKEEGKVGNLHENPFVAHDVGVTELSFGFNNVELPCTKYSSNGVADRGQLINYGTFIDALCAGRASYSNLIDFDSWLKTMRFYCVDTSPDHCSGTHKHMHDEGQLTIRARFKAALNDNYYVAIYACTHEEMLLDMKSNVWKESRAHLR